MLCSQRGTNLFPPWEQDSPTVGKDGGMYVIDAEISRRNQDREVPLFLLWILLRSYFLFYKL